MYKDFLKTEKGTNGEYRHAVEAYAWSDFYLKSGESVFVGLEKGNVIAFPFLILFLIYLAKKVYKPPKKWYYFLNISIE